MKKSQLVTLIVLTPILLILALIFGYGIYASSGRAIIVNSSGHRISGNLEICDTDYRIDALTPGEKRVIWYEKTRFGRHQITLNLDSGITLDKDLGRITLDVPTREILVVEPSSIKEIMDYSF